jgi:hypothetical protein
MLSQQQENSIDYWYTRLLTEIYKNLPTQRAVFVNDILQSKGVLNEAEYDQHLTDLSRLRLYRLLGERMQRIKSENPDWYHEAFRRYQEIGLCWGFEVCFYENPEGIFHVN